MVFFFFFFVARSSVLCSVTHNSCSVVSLRREGINDVSGTGAIGAVRKELAGVCVCFVSSVFVSGRVVSGLAVFIF